MSNPKREPHRLTSSSFSELTSSIVVDGARYDVRTEKFGTEKIIILTNAFRNGEMVSSKKIDCSHPTGDAGFDEKLRKLMRDQHLSVINTFKAQKPRKRKMVAVYLEEVKNLIRGNNREEALKTLDEALTEYPFNALLLSYYGYLDAIVNKNYERGVDLCKTAVEISSEESKEAGSLRHKGSDAVLYLHLGRVYLAIGTKKSAVEAFKRGLEADPKDPYLLSELRRIGVRREPIFSFLKRSNPINKYIGMLLHNK